MNDSQQTVLHGKRNYYPFLCMMMFMQFAVYGLWLPIAGRFLKADPTSEGGLGFDDVQAGWIIGLAASVGAICSPLIVQLADRRWSAQRVLGLLMIGGGIVKGLKGTGKNTKAAYLTESLREMKTIILNLLFILLWLF